MMESSEFSSNNQISDDANSSDEELQEAFAAGLLKPGLNIQLAQKTFKNNVDGLKQKIHELELKLDWIEKLDIICQPAPMAPEMFHELSQKENIVKLKTHMQPFSKKTGSSIALDDFKREMLFHRQAQSAVLEGISRLNSMGIPTQRPDDYFAEMAKSDAHMHKIRQSLAARKAGVQRAERLSELRKQRKLNKQTQVEKKIKQAEDKKKMLNEVKKFRKGVRKDLNFLDGKENAAPSSQKKSQHLRKKKDERFGFGGKKRGQKRNTAESSAGGKRSKGPATGRKLPGKGGPKKKIRPGKSKRNKSKGRRK